MSFELQGQGVLSFSRSRSTDMRSLKRAPSAKIKKETRNNEDVIIAVFSDPALPTLKRDS